MTKLLRARTSGIVLCLFSFVCLFVCLFAGIFPHFNFQKYNKF